MLEKVKKWQRIALCRNGLDRRFNAGSRVTVMVKCIIYLSHNEDRLATELSQGVVLVESLQWTFFDMSRASVQLFVTFVDDFLAYNGASFWTFQTQDIIDVICKFSFPIQRLAFSQWRLVCKSEQFCKAIVALDFAPCGTGGCVELLWVPCKCLML